MESIYANQWASRYPKRIGNRYLPRIVVNLPSFYRLPVCGVAEMVLMPRAEDTETDMNKTLSEAQQAIDIVYSMEALISEKLVSGRL